MKEKDEKFVFASVEENEKPVPEAEVAVLNGADVSGVKAIDARFDKEEDFGDEDTFNDKPLDKNVRLLSPTRMVLKRFFRSKLSIVGLIIVLGLIIFSWLGPVIFGGWEETEVDNSGMVEYEYVTQITYTDDSGTHTMYQVVEREKIVNSLAPLGSYGTNNDGNQSIHLFGTDKSGYDVFTRIMFGGRISLTISFIAVFVTTFLGIVFGGISGYFGGWVDNLIMRLCDVLMCLPGLPLMLVIGTILEGFGIEQQYKIYFLMFALTLVSWPGTARLVRGQILSLREQEYMVAADAMGYSSGRKIFKHLVPNVMPQIIVSMTLSLGSMILYEATLSYLNLGVKAPYAAWGTMINIVSEDPNILTNYFNVWGPPGICIILAVVGFNFIGDGLRDALDPRMKR